MSLKFPPVFRILGYLLSSIGIAMLLPAAFSLYYKEGDLPAILLSSFISIVSGIILVLLFRRARDVGRKESFLIVSSGWVLAGIAGSLPFFFSGIFGTPSISSFTDSLFESVSGFTTTGASVTGGINLRVDEWPRGLLLWRGMNQWLGGLGIVVLMVAVLPFLGTGGAHLFTLEVPGLPQEKLRKLTPHIRDTARILWAIYMTFTVSEMILLIIAGMPFYHALTHSFTTMATGGFSTKGASIEGFNSPSIEYIIVFFMLMAGINFNLHYALFRGDLKAYLKNEESRVFLLVVLFSALFITLNLALTGNDSLPSSFRSSLFQTVSIITTTGYTSRNYEGWPSICQFILFLFMFSGACSGSTGGGIKFMRIILFFKLVFRELTRAIHPKAFIPLKVMDRVVSEDILRSLFSFFGLFVLIFLASSALLMLLGIPPLTSFGAVAASLGNIGPGFGMVGPSGNYATLPEIAKFILMGCMILGRLEIFTFLVVFTVRFWKE